MSESQLTDGQNIMISRQLLNRKKCLSKQRGVTLIELMVALVIGLVVSLAVYSVLTTAEGRKRTTTSINDIDKAGAFAAYQLNKALSNAGSGFTAGLNPEAGGLVSSAAYSFGCQLSVARNNAGLLPSAGGFGAFFVNVPNNLTLVPAVILDGGATDGVNVTGDIIISMSGSAGLSESITNLTAVNAAGLEVVTTAGLSANDRILLVEAGGDGTAEPGGNCLFDQVQAGFVQGTGSTQSVPLAGDYHGAIGAAYDNSSIVLNMGKAPQFNMYGVGDNNTLFKYDLLLPQAANTNPSAFIEGVFRMEAIYGTSAAAGDFQWQAPAGDFSSEALLAADAAANDRLQKITLIRVAMVMRTNLSEKDQVSSGTVTLFEDVPALKQTLDGLDQNFRYRVIETIIPIRNVIARIE